MGLFNKMTEPAILKEDSEAEKQLTALRELSDSLNGKNLESITYLLKIMFGEITLDL